LGKALKRHAIDTIRNSHENKTVYLKDEEGRTKQELADDDFEEERSTAGLIDQRLGSKVIDYIDGHRLNAKGHGFGYSKPHKSPQTLRRYALVLKGYINGLTGVETAMEIAKTDQKFSDRYRSAIQLIEQSKIDPSIPPILTGPSALRNLPKDTSQTEISARKEVKQMADVIFKNYQRGMEILREELGIELTF